MFWDVGSGWLVVWNDSFIHVSDCGGVVYGHSWFLNVMYSKWLLAKCRQPCNSWVANTYRENAARRHKMKLSKERETRASLERANAFLWLPLCLNVGFIVVWISKHASSCIVTVQWYSDSGKELILGESCRYLGSWSDSLLYDVWQGECYCELLLLLIKLLYLDRFHSFILYYQSCMK